MKPSAALIAAAALCLSLCACGENAPVSPDVTAAPAPVESAAPVETPTVTESPAEERYPIAVPLGEARTADLDGDGTEEEICVSLADDGGYDRIVVTLNGEDVSDALYESCAADCPEESFWFLTDVYTVDNLLEIAVQDRGPSDDPHTMFLRYEPGGVYVLGDVPGLIRTAQGNGGISFEADGFVHTDCFRLSVLQTWFAAADYEIGNAGWLTPVPQEAYGANPRTEVTVTASLAAYDSVGDADYDTLEPGTALTLLSTDNAEWVLADTDRGAVWLHLNPENPFEIETPTGYLSGWEALEGLCLAD